MTGEAYFKVSRCAALAGSTQFVIAPVRSMKRVIGNCGSQSTSRPPKLPVMLAARKPAKAPSSKWTPTPPLAVIVGPLPVISDPQTPLCR